MEFTTTWNIFRVFLELPQPYTTPKMLCSTGEIFCEQRATTKSIGASIFVRARSKGFVVNMRELNW